MFRVAKPSRITLVCVPFLIFCAIANGQGGPAHLIGIPEYLRWLTRPTHLPVFDIIAQVKTSPPNSPNFSEQIEGSFRLMEKTDYGFSYARPRFFINSGYLEDRSYSANYKQLPYDIRGGWQELTYNDADLHMSLPSDLYTEPPTPAIIGFSIPLPTSTTVHWVAVVMEGRASEKDERESAPLLRHEFSFAICREGQDGENGLDTNSIVPIDLMPSRHSNNMQIGSSDDDKFWLFDFFSSWERHYHLDSTPRIMTMDYAPLMAQTKDQIDWFNEGWKPAYYADILYGLFGSGVLFSDAANVPTLGKRTVSPQYSKGGDDYMLMIYSPDISDMVAQKRFQISGVIVPRSWRFPW